MPIAETGPVTERLQVREIDDDEGPRLVRIICRGTGLMAGSPGGIARPARVTVPTPAPARNATPLPGSGHLDSP